MATILTEKLAHIVEVSLFKNAARDGRDRRHTGRDQQLRGSQRPKADR
jgi:hypothetical protein